MGQKLLEGMELEYYHCLDDVFSHVKECVVCGDVWDWIGKHKKLLDTCEKIRIADANTGPTGLREEG